MLQKDNRYKILQVFFEDPLPQGIGFQLREISRKAKLAPLSVKNYLNDLEKANLITLKKHRIHSYPVYYANRDNPDFKFSKKINTIQLIKDSGLLQYLKDTYMPDTIILFGSASKGEDLKDSDLDLFLLSSEKHSNLQKYEKQLCRKINIFFCEDFSKLSNEFKNNLINGIILSGYLKVF